MIIAISGTPGCGKTTIANRLAKLISFEHIELTQFIKEDKIADNFDTKDQTFDVDVKRLVKKLQEKLDPKKDYILDGHFSHDLTPLLQGCIVCTCELKELKKRLENRQYNEQKVRDNLDAEIFDTCYTESTENEVPTVKLNCSNEISDTLILKTYDKLMKEVKA